MCLRNLDSGITSDDGNLEILGYNLIRYDHPSNSKRGEVCNYCKRALPLRVLIIHFVQESIRFELKIGDKFFNIISLCSSPSQTQDEFEKYSENHERILDRLFRNNPFLVVSNWYYHDKSWSEGNAVDTITKQYVLHQVIKEPADILDSSSNCIDFIFTLQPNLITESGVQPSLHPKCYHQIVYAKFNLQIEFSPPCSRELLHHKDANTELQKGLHEKINCQKAFLNISVNEKVVIFNKTVLNILSYFVPHETIVCDDKNPLWFNNKIKTLIQAKTLHLIVFEKIVTTLN